MSYQLTLISAPEAKCLDDDFVAGVSQLLDAQPRILAPREAAQWELPDGTNSAILEPQILSHIGSRPIDWMMMRGVPMIYLMIADMDSTIIQQECLDALADHVGLGEEIAAITRKAMNGDIPFEAALLERVAKLKGVPDSTLQTVLDQQLSLTPGATTLLATLRDLGVYTALVSGGFTFFTHRIAQALRFDDNQANQLEIDGGLLTGRIMPPIFGRHAKYEALLRYCDLLDISTEQALCVGDGANDLEMIEAAGIGVAFQAKPIVEQKARCIVRHADLTALLYIMGISKDRFVHAPTAQLNS